MEKSFAGTESQNFVSDIFQGMVVNYTQCLECHYESVREETFMDLNITVKDVFRKVYNDSLEKGLQRYLKPEILEGDN